MTLRDSPADAWGRAAETVLAKVFESCGYFVLPVHLIQTGSAPMLVGEFRKIIAQDLLIAKNGTTKSVDIKFKACPAMYNMIGRWRHGTDLHQWRAYLDAQTETGLQGSIALLQYAPGPEAPPDPCWYFQTLSQLASTVQENPSPTKKAPRGMAYWDVDEMDFMGRLDFRAPDVPLLTRTIHEWERSKKMNVAEQQRSLFSWASLGDTANSVVEDLRKKICKADPIK